MAELKQDEQLAEPQTVPEETAQETSGEAPQESPGETAQEKPEETPKDPNRRSILLPVLTILLVLVGIGEAIFWGYFGFSAYARSLARERYEQQQKALAEEQVSKGIKGGSSYSPNLKVENGTVTWEREKREYAESSQPTSTSATPRREDGLRLARLPVFKIPYLLAEMDTDGELPSAQTGKTTPAST